VTLRRLVSFLAVSCLLLPSIGFAQAGESVARFEPAACKIGPPAGATLHCGYLIVPERRDMPDGATIRLAVAVVSGGHPTSTEPVVYLAGGPGEAGSTDLGPMNGLLDDNDWIFLVTLSSSPCSIGIARAFLRAPDREPASACATGGDVTFVLP